MKKQGNHRATFTVRKFQRNLTLKRNIVLHSANIEKLKLYVIKVRRAETEL